MQRNGIKEIPIKKRGGEKRGEIRECLKEIADCDIQHNKEGAENYSKNIEKEQKLINGKGTEKERKKNIKESTCVRPCGSRNTWRNNPTFNPGRHVNTPHRWIKGLKENP